MALLRFLMRVEELLAIHLRAWYKLKINFCFFIGLRSDIVTFCLHSMEMFDFCCRMMLKPK